jgi:hypothetical protein
MQTENKPISSTKMYTLLALHLLRILIMAFFWICPLVFICLSVYCIFASEWIKSIIFATMCLCVYFSYPMINSWFEDGRLSFKNAVDEFYSINEDKIK